MFGVGRARPHDNPGDPTSCSVERRLHPVHALEERHVRKGLDAATDGCLETGPADAHSAQPRFVAQLPAAVLEPEEVAGDIAARRADRLELVHHAREIVVHHTVAAGEQAMRVAGLGDTLAHVSTVGQDVAFDNR